MMGIHSFGHLFYGGEVQKRILSGQIDELTCRQNNKTKITEEGREFL